MNISNEIARLIYKAMDDKKAENISIIDISEISTIADYFVICSSANASQTDAITDNIIETLGKAGHTTKRIEGHQRSTWILMDYGDVIAHIFSREDRAFYDLDRIWRDGKRKTVEEL